MTRAFSTQHRRLTALRLAAQGVDAAGAPSSVPETVRRMLALQAQDLAGAMWSVGLRSAGSTLSDVEAAIAAGTVVRS
jgi:hypothetical protein